MRVIGLEKNLSSLSLKYSCEVWVIERLPRTALFVFAISPKLAEDRARSPGCPLGEWGRARADSLIHYTTLALRQRSFVLLCRHLLLSRLIDMSTTHRWTVSFYAGRTKTGVFKFLFPTQFLYFVEIFWLISKEIFLSRVYRNNLMKLYVNCF